MCGGVTVVVAMWGVDKIPLVASLVSAGVPLCPRDSAAAGGSPSHEPPPSLRDVPLPRAVATTGGASPPLTTHPCQCRPLVTSRRRRALPSPEPSPPQGLSLPQVAAIAGPLVP
uniref:Uncharacterized protein n=1 Tax=Oryza sativa subsp. japonica TaxID=39947 RepID=Q6Z1F5_ORYSJ|nr:hypothetical protein [Oryza sativa Japonica Group]